MQYYHVAFANKRGEVRWAFAFDMSREQVHQHLVLPFLKQRSFMCGKRVIHPSEIEIIKISQTNEKSSEILARGRKKRTIRKVSQQEIETLINEEALLLAMCLRNERESWKPRIADLTRA